MRAAMMPNATGAPVALLVRVQRLLDPRVPRHARLQLTVAATGFLAFAAADAAAPSVERSLLPTRWLYCRLSTVNPHTARMTGSPCGANAAAARRDAYWTPAFPRVARPPTTTASASSADCRATSQFRAYSSRRRELKRLPPVSEPSLLHSRALPSAITLTAARSTDDNDSAWIAAARAGAALGGSFAQMGTATGTQSKRAGSAVGGFFSRAGKAVADSF